MTRLLAATLLLGLWAPSPVTAQANRLQLADAAVRGLLEEYTESVTGKLVAIDGTFLSSGQNEELAVRTNTAPARKADTLECSERIGTTDRHCVLLETDYLMVLLNAQISGQEAIVDYEFAGNDERGLGQLWLEGGRVTLKREAGGWVLVAVESIWES